MSARFDRLFEPLQLGPIEIPNRICWSAHSTHLAVDGLPSERQVAYYAERARGGAGWIVVGGSPAHESSLWEQGFNLVSDSRAVPGYQQLTSAVHEHGAKISTQLDTYGIGVPANRPFPWPVYAPSALPTGPQGEVAKAVDEADMKMFIQAAVDGVEVAIKGGFDGIELLASFDVSLMQNFLSPRFNKRTDEYGGSLENRMRFPLRMIDAVKQALDGRGCLGLKIVGDEMEEGGLTQDDVKEICARIDELGLVDYFHICLGTVNSYHLVIPEMSYPAGFAAYLAGGVREIVKVPVVAVKRIDDPIVAERLLADGQADIVGMTRALLADPDLPNKARDGMLDEIRHCTASNQECTRRAEDHVKLPLRCVHNPAVGFESKLGAGTLARATTSRSIIVVGGGPAGMRAAKVAAQRGHRVRLYEQSDELGGQVRSILQVPSRSGYESVIRYLSGELDRRGVDVRLGERATAESIAAEGPDAVVVATGALGVKTGFSATRPMVTEMPGAAADHVLTVFDVFASPEEIGERVVVVDEFGDYEAMVTTEFLAQIDRQVTYVTRQTHAGARVDGASLTGYGERLAEGGVVTQPMTAVTAIDGNVVRGENQLTGGAWSSEADSVVLLMGKRPDDELYQQLDGRVPEIHRVGDCVAPRQITDAIFEGNVAGRTV